jgi:hypothetical protein
MELDFVSEKIISCLRMHPKWRLIDISSHTKIPLVEIYERYYQLRNADLIKHKVIFNIERLELTRSLVVIEFKYPDPLLHPNKQLIEFLKNCPFVNSLSLTERGLLADVIFLTTALYDLFIDAVRRYEIKELSEYMITEQLCAEKFIPDSI